jgi:hypothetical protein
MDNKYEIDFWKVNWGPDEAKGDSNLSQYFIRVPEYDGLKKGEYRYIVGRKGTGKTAILENLMNEDDYTKVFKSLSLKNFPIQILKNLRDKSMVDKSQFVPAWTFLIVVELCKLVATDEKAEPLDDANELRQFVLLNFPEELGFVETLKKLEEHQNKIAILPKWAGFESKNSVIIESQIVIHFQKATELLLKKLKGINSELKYFLLFDELDEGYKASDSNNRLLILSLLRAVENLFLDLKEHLNFRPILALRSDIFDNLEDNDLNKLDDHIVRLNWTTESKSVYSLSEMVNARINASIRVVDPEDAWSCISFNNDSFLPHNVKSLWNFVVNQTFERPRDVIKYLKCCNKINASGKLSYQTVKDAEASYSKWFYDEFRDEVQSHLPIWQAATHCFMKLGKGMLRVDEIKKEFESDATVAAWFASNNKNHEDLLKILFDFGLIGTISPTGKWFFKYKDHNLPFNPKQQIIVHYGFLKKFRIKTLASKKYR